MLTCTTPDVAQFMQDHPAIRASVQEWAITDQYFLQEFATLLIEGSTEDGSWPSDIDEIREMVLAGFKATTEAEVVAEARRASESERAMMTKLYQIQLQIREIREAFNASGLMATLKHETDMYGHEDCPKCRLHRALLEQE